MADKMNKINSSDAEDLYKIITKEATITYNKNGVCEKILEYKGEKLGSIELKKDGDGSYASLSIYINNKGEKADLFELLEIKNNEEINNKLVEIKQDLSNTNLEEILAFTRDMRSLGSVDEILFSMLG